jgi:hypothetical protein
VRYFQNLPPGKIVLWCFLIWYTVTVIHHFDPSPAIWLNALGISAIIGIALYLSVRELAISLVACTVFVIVVLVMKRVARGVA